MLLEKSEKSRRSTLEGGAGYGSVSTFDRARRSLPQSSYVSPISTARGEGGALKKKATLS